MMKFALIGCLVGITFAQGNGEPELRENGRVVKTNGAADAYNKFTEKAQDALAPHTNAIKDMLAPHANAASDMLAPPANAITDMFAPHANTLWNIFTGKSMCLTYFFVRLQFSFQLMFFLLQRIKDKPTRSCLNSNDKTCSSIL